MAPGAEVGVRLDRSPRMSEQEVVENLHQEIPNFPSVLHPQAQEKSLAANTSCTKYPSVIDLKLSNKYWQILESSNGTFHLYGAYLDVRPANRLGPTLRILGMLNRLEPKVKTVCQIWFADSDSAVVSSVLEYKYIWNKSWGNYKQGIFQPYLMACKLPMSHLERVPVSVSLVEAPCDAATNNLRVVDNRLKEGEVKNKFAVCVKGLDFPEDDLSVRIIEWIETLVSLGADKIFLYELEVHPNVSRVLRHYQEEGRVDLTPISLPGYQPNVRVLQHIYLKGKLINKRQNELIPYNDCLYRNMYRYEYLALLDIDEIITPVRHNSWADMMREVIEASSNEDNELKASWNFRNVYFLDEMLEANEGPGNPFPSIPSYLHMLQHVYRSANYTKPGAFVKCFHNPAKALILHNHFPLGCLGGACTSYPVAPSLGQLQHYRSDCVSSLKQSCKEDFKAVSVKDTSLWKWKDEIIQRSSKVLHKLGFFQVLFQPPSSTNTATTIV